jgi:hypothetical protein
MPSYPISCPNCKSRLQIPIKLAPGKKIRCPRCNTIFLFQESPKNPKNQPPEGITRISLKASSRKKEQKDEHISPGKSLPGRGRKKAIFWGAFGSLLLVGTTFFFFPKNIAEKKDGLTLTQVTDNQETDGIAKKDNSQPENKLIPPQQNETPPSTEKPEPTQTQKQPENLAPPSDSKKEENIPQEKPNLTQVILPNAQPEVTNIRPNGQAKAPTLMGGLALPEWEKGLRDEDVKIRLKTLNNLFKLSPSELEWLLPDLHKLMVDDSNTLVRATAARIMGNLGPRALAAVPSLIELVTDKEEPATVRDNAIRTLGKIGPNAKAAVPALIKTLETLGGTEVNSAIQSLLLMETEVVPELIAWMEKEQKLGRENVLKALSLFAKDNNEALQGLGKALSDQEPIIRIKAATELGRLGLSKPAE